MSKQPRLELLELLVSHHPDCDSCSDVFKIKNVQVCRSCSFLILGFLAIILIQINNLIPYEILFSTIIVLIMIIPSFIHIFHTPRRRIKDVSRFFAGVSIGYTAMIFNSRVLSEEEFFYILLCYYIFFILFFISYLFNKIRK